MADYEWGGQQTTAKHLTALAANFNSADKLCLTDKKHSEEKKNQALEACGSNQGGRAENSRILAQHVEAL